MVKNTLTSQNHEVVVQGVSLAGQPQPTPALLQMNDDDFPARFLTDLAAKSVTTGSTISTIQTSAQSPVTLYQPVQRTVHLALLQLTCNSVGFPRLDPSRVDSAGLVIRRVRTLDDPPSAWMRSSITGKSGWVTRTRLDDCQDPDPVKQPRVASGQPALDQLLTAQSLLNAQSETFTPAFVAAPNVCNAAKATLVYALIPTASSEISTKPPVTPQYGSDVTSLLTTLLSQVSHSAFMAGQSVDYQWMSDDYAKARNSQFLTFSSTLRLLYSVFGAFENTSQAQALIAELNKFNVNVKTAWGVAVTMPMGTFYQNAAASLMDYDPFSKQAAPPVFMPNSWDNTDPAGILAAVQALLQARTASVVSPIGRFQDSNRIYRLRIFLRIKGHTASCPPHLVWSSYSDPFRIAAWHEAGGRVMAPVPLPDPTDPDFRKNAKKSNCYFAVPSALMNLMQGSSLSGLSSGSGPAPGASGGISLNWICGFNIPLITICAFFVLNLFLVVLNLVFFWLPFIKICIPFPIQPPGTTGDDDGQ